MVGSLFAACGDSGQSVSIAMQVDEESCGASLDALELRCGTVWLQVRDASGMVLSSDCVELTTTPMPLRSLGEILGQSASLGSLPSNERLRIRLALFDVPLNPCPTMAPEREPVLDGQTQLIVLAEQESDIQLDLSCAQLNDGLECSVCEGDLQACLQSAGDCEAIEQACLEGQCRFFEDGCTLPCDLLAQRCVDSDDPQHGPMLQCDGLLDECAQSCGAEGNACEEYCQELEFSCMQTAAQISDCEQSAEPCFQDCGPIGSCLAPP